MATPFVPPSEPIQPLGLVGPTLQPVPNIETRTEEQYFQDVTTPTGLKPIRPDAATPAPADPFAEFQDAGFEQFQDAPDQFANFQTADDLDVKSVEELDKDRDNFRPVDYFNQNPDVANDPKKLAKLLEVYRRRDKEGLTAKGVVKAAVKETPGLIADIGGGIKRLGERAIDTLIQPTANVVLGTLTGDLFDDQKRAALFNETRKNIKKGVGEVAAGSEAATVGLVDLARTGARKVPYTGTEFEPIPLPTPKTDQELLKQLADDAAFRQNAEAIARGEGEAAKNFGLDKETLAKQGITMDENAIRQLSLVDPITMLATGGAFKVVGAGGKVLATAATIEGAQQFVDKLAKVSKVAVGKTVQGTGKAASFVGEKLQGTGRSAAIITGIGTAMRGGSPLESLAMAAAAKAVGPAVRKTGGVLEHAGKAIAGEVPVSANLQKVLDYAVKPAAGVAGATAKGVFDGMAAAAPFAIAAQDDETAGALLGVGSALGAVGSTAAQGFRVVKNSAARRYFGENRPVLPDVASPAYGRDAALDAAHEANITKLSAQDASELNNFREALRQQGGEIYATDRQTFRNKVADGMRANGVEVTPEMLDVYENHSAFFDTSQGDRKVVYLNSDTTGLQHDAGHIFDAVLSPEKRAELRSAVEAAFTPEQRKQFRDTYERRVGNKISDTAAVDEFIAEQFAALFNNVPVTELNAPKSLLNKFIDTAAEAAESLGIDLSSGATTPNLGAPVSIGIRQLFRNAAGDVIRANIEGVPPTNVTPFPGGPTPPTGGAPVVPPPTAPVVPPPPPGNVVPLPGAPSRNIRVGPENVASFKQSASPEVRAAADARARETGVDYARTEAKKADGSPTSQIIERISDSMESGRPVVQIDHLGITSESTPDAPLGRTARRGEQSAGYAALEAAQLDVRQNAPPEIVSQHSKNFVPVRWTDQGGTPTLIAMSLDKVIANMMKVAADPKAKDLIPYPVENGKFTPEGWRQVVADAQAYSENQANGRKGDGGRLEVPEAGLSIPAENPAYTPQPLSPERANFQNLVQGLAPPQTARAQKGTIPGNVKGQVLAEANRRPTETPANITPQRAGKQAFAEFPGRTVQETNPLRNELERRGVKTRELIEVTERIRAKDIVAAEARPEINYSAPVTDTIRGGFLPAPDEFKQKFLVDGNVEEFAKKVVAATPEEWKAATDNMAGGLTGGAWNLGLGLTDKADVPKLLKFHQDLSQASKNAMLAGDFERAMTLVGRSQFFREAYEAATGTGSALTAFKNGRLGDPTQTPPFPFAEKTKATTSTAGDTGTTITISESGTAFLPAEELNVGTAESRPELRVIPPAAPGGRPPTNPPLPSQFRPPPVAAGFLPAEELPAEETADLRVIPAAAGAGTPPTGTPSRLRPPPVAASVAQQDETPRFLPKADEKIQDLAKSYADSVGLSYSPKGGYAEVKPDLAKRLADYYDSAKSEPENPEVAASYDALIRETEEQGKAILAAGYTIEPWTGAGEPYKNSAEAIADVRDNKHLFFRKSEGAFAGTADNPMLRESTLVPGQSVNDVFRWVHDFFGHAKEGYQFGPRGEFNAWRAHSEMYSPEAQGALAAETLAQNSWVNFGKHLEGKNIPPAERPFAEQKNVLVPESLVAEASGFLPQTEAGRKLEERGFEVVPSGILGNRRVAVLKGGEEVAVIQSVQRAPTTAEIAMVQKYKGAPKGVGEVLYRELGSQLQADGVTEVTGNVISPEPLAIRRKVFGDFASIDLNGEPATFDQALSTAERIQNRTENEVAAIEPVNTISDSSRFLPKVKRDAQGRPLDKEGNIDYARWQREGIAARKKREAEPMEEVTAKGPLVSGAAGVSTGWLLPDRTFVPLDANFHEQYLANNAADLNKKFKTTFSDVPSVEERLTALNNGFVRFRNLGGSMKVEANAKSWPRQKSKVLETLTDREGSIDNLTVALLNDKGNQIDSVSSPRLHELSPAERIDAIGDAIGELRGGRFLPAGDEGLPGIGLPSVEEVGRAKAARRISSVKKNNPEAVVPQYARDENGQVIIKPDGEPKTVTLDYNFIDTPVAREAAKGLKGVAREEAATAAVGDKLVDLYKTVEKNPDIKAGAKWYSTARTRLKKVFGDDAKFFAELLGATSARTPVDINFRFALDAYNQFKLGAFDKILAKYREGKAKWDAQDLGDFKGETRGQFMDYWVDKHDLSVRQSNGKKFGMNGRAVLRVLDGSWASEVQGPKTPNFAGNLTGETFEATIDVWAARTLARLANEDGKTRWRILPENETGVTDADFYFGQAAYRAAAQKLGIKPDALQAVLWFAEKDHWEKKGWTRGAGAEKSDFNVLLNETERTPDGTMRMKTPQIGLDFGAEIGNTSKKKK